MEKLLIANRGEIAIRIARTASEMGIRSVAIYAEDDAESLHLRMTDEAINLGQVGVPAYLNGARILEIASERGCDAVHPGYGFLSESAEFAHQCEAAEVTFVGPSPKTLDLFGNKASARKFAEECGVPLLPGLSCPVTIEEARSFFVSLKKGSSVMLKALAGGGGRGMRPVERLEDLPSAFARASSEANKFFGSGELYIEELLPCARHVEVQIVGDGTGAASHLWDRECSLQRQRQKLVEIAPAFELECATRDAILDAAVRLAQASHYRGVGTIEFLVNATPGGGGSFVFMEANPRLQVEHTVTEEVLGLDIVRSQLQLADGATLGDLSLGQGNVPQPRGVAIQVRVNLEVMAANGTSRPSVGVLKRYEPPNGVGVRVDGYGYPGYSTSPRYDSLLAKVVVHAENLSAASAKACRALSEFVIAGVGTNINFLQALLKSPALSKGELYTRYVEDHIGQLLGASSEHVGGSAGLSS